MEKNNYKSNYLRVEDNSAEKGTPVEPKITAKTTETRAEMTEEEKEIAKERREEQKNLLLKIIAILLLLLLLTAFFYLGFIISFIRRKCL